MMIDAKELLMLGVVTLVGFLGWLLQSKFSQLEAMGERVTTIETKLDVMGDINLALAELKTDVAVIKHSLEHK